MTMDTWQRLPKISKVGSYKKIDSSQLELHGIGGKVQAKFVVELIIKIASCEILQQFWVIEEFEINVLGAQWLMDTSAQIDFKDQKLIFKDSNDKIIEHTHPYICVCIYMDKRIYVCVYTWINANKAQVYMCMDVYICMYTYTYTLEPDSYQSTELEGHKSGVYEAVFSKNEKLISASRGMLACFCIFTYR